MFHQRDGEIHPRDRIIDAAIRLHVDGPARNARALLLRRGRTIVEEDRQLRDLLARTLTPTSNCIDIGANRGRVLAALVHHAPRGRHIAYEPLPDLHRMLVARYPSLDIRCAAVSNRRGEASFTVVRDAPALSGFRDRWHGGEHVTTAITVRLETLDDDLPHEYVPHFIKVDVEGSERLVFEGGLRTIATHKPTILFEHGRNGAEHYDTTPADVHELLVREAGLRIFTVAGRGPLDRMQFEQIFERNQEWNFVACR
jgi:FkbM family methyltransferase